MFGMYGTHKHTPANHLCLTIISSSCGQGADTVTVATMSGNCCKSSIDNLVIFNKKKPKDVPAITKKEFLEFEKANQLIKFLKEF